jgi:hypothetical protein
MKVEGMLGSSVQKINLLLPWWRSWQARWVVFAYPAILWGPHSSNSIVKRLLCKAEGNSRMSWIGKCQVHFCHCLSRKRGGYYGIFSGLRWTPSASSWSLMIAIYWQ